MARSTRSQSQNSSLASKTTGSALDPHTELPAGERTNLHAVSPAGDLEDGEISDDAKSPGESVKESLDTQLPAIAEAPPPSEPGGPPTPPPDVILRGESPVTIQLPPVTPLSPLPQPHPHRHQHQHQPSPSQNSPQDFLQHEPSSDPLENTNRALSDEELDHAKSLVLDLLGWGVEPEYLVDCGVSAPVLYRIFTDLHLRLPTNLAYFN
ncbi:hypothetical protein BDZ94DRAFT_1266133 [Collybia nuda]|uniref:Uncharacterized protein n=1 Tax=Collybia nuda TaxID=64659 RepID=A0A9P5Y131_9AGAR|nr:hypothetical protein BDZ94DRAFT_1266133 [Collybia nuda]